MTAHGRNDDMRITVTRIYPQAFIKLLRLPVRDITLETMLIRLAYTLPFAILAATASQAQMGDVTCDDSTRMIATLENVLGAERQGMGLRDPETTLEVWVAGGSGDWIIVQNYANGTSCIVAMGEHWEGYVQGPA